MAVHERTCKVCGKQFGVPDGVKQFSVHHCKSEKVGAGVKPVRGRVARTSERDTGN